MVQKQQLIQVHVQDDLTTFGVFGCESVVTFMAEE